ncbi:MAG TPA: LysR substrate-binding domain-containing protein [Polyangiaceae bacterium]|jgi:DNA-binding transcriptional LysR family regulator|nr:LysR substrate-binding domain-containing protein [Polyangiaceae bacterium]
MGVRARRKRVSAEVRGALILDAPTLMHEAALAGVGLAYLAEWSVTDDVKAGRLVPRPCRLDALRRQALYYPANRHVPAGLRAFVAMIREVGKPPSL